MSTESEREESNEDQQLDLEIVDLYQPSDSNEIDAGFKSGGGSCGCKHQVDGKANSTSSAQ